MLHQEIRVRDTEGKLVAFLPLEVRKEDLTVSATLFPVVLEAEQVKALQAPECGINLDESVIVPLRLDVHFSDPAPFPRRYRNAGLAVNTGEKIALAPEGLCTAGYSLTFALSSNEPTHEVYWLRPKDTATSAFSVLPTFTPPAPFNLDITLFWRDVQGLVGVVPTGAANIRAEPNADTDANILSTIQVGQVALLPVLDSEPDADGQHIWYRVTLPEGAEASGGWVRNDVVGNGVYMIDNTTQ